LKSDPISTYITHISETTSFKVLPQGLSPRPFWFELEFRTLLVKKPEDSSLLVFLRLYIENSNTKNGHKKTDRPLLIDRA